MEQNVTAITLASPPGGSNTEIQFNSGGTAFGGSANLVWDGTNVVIGATGALRLGDTTGGEYVGLKAPGTVSSSVTFTLPGADGSADEFLKTDGSGNLTFAAVSGGTSWQAVKTTGFTAVAGEGYFCDTSSAGFTATLPATPTLGDEVTFVDYAGTFDTNNLTVGRNSENIQGSAADLTVSVERAGLTLVYSGATQGWLLKDK
jgi:trimeric autotransporter adhesin